MKEGKIWKVVLFLAVIGIFLASYLFYNYLIKPPLQLCYINSNVNCDAVTKGEISTLFGVPVSLVGLIGYIVILISSIIKNKKMVFYMAGFGMVFCLYITFQEVFFLKVICPVCLACQLDMLLVFLLGLKLNFLTDKISLKKNPQKD